MVLRSSSSHEDIPAAKSTPCFSFHLAPLMTKCATIQVDNNFSADLPLPLFLLSSTPVYSLCARAPRGLHQPLDTTLSASSQTTLTNHSTLSTTDTHKVTYNHFTSFDSYPLTLPPTSTLSTPWLLARTPNLLPPRRRSPTRRLPKCTLAARPAP